jgi:myo-inositol-1(or 4)-monophosphatase
MSLLTSGCLANSLPMTCVSIGLCHNRKPILGVVYAPMTDELYVALAGHGAFRNGVLISQRSSKPLIDSIVCFEFGYARKEAAVRKMVNVVRDILNHGCRTTRSIGSGVLDLCYVATGRIDVVYAGVAGEHWKPWDYCAGYVVATEAGCVVESIQGPEFDIYSGSIICAVGSSLANEVRKIITTEAAK